MTDAKLLNVQCPDPGVGRALTRVVVVPTGRSADAPGHGKPWTLDIAHWTFPEGCYAFER